MPERDASGITMEEIKQWLSHLLIGRQAAVFKNGSLETFICQNTCQKKNSVLCLGLLSVILAQ